MGIKLYDVLFSILAFVAVFYFYGLVSFFGMRNFMAPGPLIDYMDQGFWHLEVWIQASVFGFLFVVINTFTQNTVIRKRSFGFHILIRSVLYFFALAIGGIIVFTSFLNFGLLTRKEFSAFFDLLSTEFIVSLLVFIGFFIVMMNFLNQLNRKFGQGELWNLITGKYRKPRDEELIFLFLDLRSSTRLAEKLGHQTYSKFLKDCIHELTPILVRNGANVHQYVGDEVVLFWRRNAGIQDKKCLRTFFEFQSRLEQLRTYFQKTYGEIPEFKGGMDAGEVTITEIGDIKREIAYHGDVVNTASRLEKKCNEFGQNLLISENLVRRLEGSNTYDYEFISDLPLRGKTKNLKFFSVGSN